jgi:hypothetical protein
MSSLPERAIDRPDSMHAATSSPSTLTVRSFRLRFALTSNNNGRDFMTIVFRQPLLDVVSRI